MLIMVGLMVGVLIKLLGETLPVLDTELFFLCLLPPSSWMLDISCLCPPFSENMGSILALAVLGRSGTPSLLGWRYMECVK